MFLAADIGGTYSRLAWLDSTNGAQQAEQVFENARFDSLESVINEGLAACGGSGEPVERMVLAVPGPVHEDPVTLTNIRWQVGRDTLRTRFRVADLMIVNDFQAAALGAVNEPYERLKVLNPATPDEGPVVVAGAGTGLGMAWLPARDYPDLPRATEGGHLDFAPNDARQLALYRALAERHGHVSYERIVSGDGLLDAYRFIAGSSVAADTPARVAELAVQEYHQPLRTFTGMTRNTVSECNQRLFRVGPVLQFVFTPRVHRAAARMFSITSVAIRPRSSPAAARSPARA